MAWHMPGWLQFPDFAFPVFLQPLAETGFDEMPSSLLSLVHLPAFVVTTFTPKLFPQLPGIELPADSNLLPHSNAWLLFAGLVQTFS